MKVNDDETLALCALIVGAILCAALTASCLCHLPRGPDRCVEVEP